ncbi:MAG: hypothetical protein KDJ36_19685, partial [Hyphomicrobiaceae bacterium]|nr:hypothetical protein [Hyphomicrobiaceae bacterium]
MATDHVFDLHFGAAADGYQGVSLYRYTEDGTRIDNITDWGLRQFQAQYEKGKSPSPVRSMGEGGHRLQACGASAHARPDEGPHPALRATLSHGKATGEGKKRKITKDDIFTYVYGVLHDPVYREKYAINLKREFPRIPFYPDFWQWAEWGKRLMDLHIGYETVEPWPLKRHDQPATE